MLGKETREVQNRERAPAWEPLYTSGSLTVRTLETKSLVIFLKKMSIILFSLEWRHSTGRKLAGLTIVLNIVKVPQRSPVSFWGK